MNTLLKDFAYAARTLRRRPGFAAVAILTIALGIGACTAIFSGVDAVLLRPLPYADAGRLATVWSELRARNVPDFPFPIPDVKDLRDTTKTFASIAAATPSGRTPMIGDGLEPEQVRVAGATTNLFSTLGVRVLVGRDFVETDGTPQPQQPQAATPPPANAVVPPAPRLPVMAILSHAFWQRRYGGDSSVIGKVVELGGQRTEIVGVLPPEFELLFSPRTGMDPSPDIWTALRLNFETATRNTGALRVVGRLKPGVTYPAAQAELDAFAADLRQRFPVKKTAGVYVRLVPMHDDLVREVRPSILALFGAVMFVLLIACANVTNLLIVRASSRRRELAIRAALGGSRWRLARELMAESILLAGGGVLLGLLVARYGIDLLLALAPAGLPRIESIGIDPMVVLFAIIAGVAAAAMFGLLPSLRASRADLMDVLRQSGGSAGLHGGGGLRKGVVLVEIALSFVLLVGAGLMIRGFFALQHVNVGFDANNLLTFVLPIPGRTPDERATKTKQVQDRLRAVPGVESVSSADALPLDGTVRNVPYGNENALSDPTAFRQATSAFVLPGYFETMRTPLLAGRTFTNDDNNNPKSDAVMIDDMLAARSFPDETPDRVVGKFLAIRSLRGPTPERLQIIGVVGHQRHESLATPGREGIFFTNGFLGHGLIGSWMVRTSGDPAAVGAAIRASLAQLDARLPIAEMRPMQTIVDRAMAPIRFAMVLVGAFAGVAVILAAIGLYGVLATIVRQRTAEIGMRMVFGAEQRDIFRLIVLEGLRLSIAGIIAGLVAAFVLTRIVSSVIVGVTPTDPPTFAAITVLFFIVSIVACWLPARRASRLDPTVALREQ
jgi:putative ABC transport system permease protein